MSSSLFDSFAYSSYPTNYLDHNEGNKTFGELKAGDKIYCHHFDSKEILEIAVKTGKIAHRDNTAFMTIEPTNISKFQKLTRLDFGPVSGCRWFGSGKKYYSSDIPFSSLCVADSGTFVFGTNRDDVLAMAKQNLASRIEDVKTEIETLNKRLGEMTEQLYILN